jgi:GTP-binding protein HflX
VKERVLVAALDDGRHEPWESWMAEMEGLVAAAGGAVVGVVVQRRERPFPGTFFGRGKVEEIRAAVAAHAADVVVVANDLSPGQGAALEEAVGCRVVDRTELILDIFARRAKTREGKLQVELAQLAYRLPRLAGRGVMLSRLGGGIGTRGPGETKLEVDRRRIEARMAHLREEIRAIARHRAVLRQGRAGVLKGALVGYTNAGKSSLLEALTEAYAGAEDQLFATLDPTARRVRLLGNIPLVLTDTVGFVRDLPHELVAAFQATLEEVRAADFLIHVVDASSPQRDVEIQAVEEVLRSLGVEGYPTVMAYNKMDLVPPSERALPPGAVGISALRREGLDELRRAILGALRRHIVEVGVRLDTDGGEAAAWLYRHGDVAGRRTLPGGGEEIVARLRREDAARFRALFPRAELIITQRMAAEEERRA